jgi:hypothetical protein
MLRISKFPSAAPALVQRLALSPARLVRPDYQVEAYGHLAAAYAVVASDADCCIGTRAAAQALGSASFLSRASDTIW